MIKNKFIQTVVTSAALALSCSAQAATPASGTISPEARTLTFTGGPFPVPNVTPQLQNEGLADPVCTPGEGAICDAFDFTLDLPDDYYTENPTDLVKIKMTWAATTSLEDYDFYLYDSAGNIINQGEGTTNPENITFCAGQGQQNYRLQIYPFTAVAATYEVTIDMQPEPKARCKAPKSATAAPKSAGQFGGALGFGLMLPLFSLLALRRRTAR